MFANTKAYSGFAVDDLHRAREFYGETLGLRLLRGRFRFERLKSGDETPIIVSRRLLIFACHSVRPIPCQR